MQLGDGFEDFEEIDTAELKIKGKDGPELKSQEKAVAELEPDKVKDAPASELEQGHDVEAKLAAKPTYLRSDYLSCVETNPEEEDVTKVEPAEKAVAELALEEQGSS